MWPPEWGCRHRYIGWRDRSNRKRAGSASRGGTSGGSSRVVDDGATIAASGEPLVKIYRSSQITYRKLDNCYIDIINEIIVLIQIRSALLHPVDRTPDFFRRRGHLDMVDAVFG